MRFRTRRSTRSLLALQSEADRSFSFGEGGLDRPLSAKRKQSARRSEVPLFTKIMQGVSIAALLLAVLWRPSASYYPLMLQMVVGVSSLMVLTQAVHARRYVWAAGSFAIAELATVSAQA